MDEPLDLLDHVLPVGLQQPEHLVDAHLHGVLDSDSNSTRYYLLLLFLRNQLSIEAMKLTNRQTKKQSDKKNRESPNKTITR